LIEDLILGCAYPEAAQGNNHLAAPSSVCWPACRRKWAAT